MTWFYVADGQRQGPVEEGAFLELVRTGKIVAETLVWNEALPQWEPYAKVYAQSVQAAQEGKPATGGPGTTTSGGRKVTRYQLKGRQSEAPTVVLGPRPEAVGGSGMTTSGGIQCQACGWRFPEDQIVPFDGGQVCVRCLPTAKLLKANQKSMPEGGFAGFWIRFAARLLDLVLLGVLIGGLLAVGVPLLAGPLGFKPEVARDNLQLGLVLVPLVYSVFFIGTFGATPGKMMLHVRVIRAKDESNPGYVRALLREIFFYISTLFLCLGHLLAVFDPEKRGVHDFVCNTRVIRG